MARDVETLKFYGMIATTLESEFGASIYDDADDAFQTRLHQEYLARGKPKNPRAWIKNELKKHFLCVGKRPVWIERMTQSRWPFFAGKPMVFIDQIAVPESESADSKVAAGAVLYVFGARKPVDDVPGGWQMVYSVVEQVPDL
jgi:hypothetical protein